MENFKEDYSNNEESVSTPPAPPTTQKVSHKEKKANAKAEKAAIKAQQAADQAQAVADQANNKAQKKAEKKAAKAHRPFYKKWWFWVIVLIAIGAMNGKGKKEDTPKDSSSTPTESVTQEAEVSYEQSSKAAIENNEKLITQELLDNELDRAKVLSEEMHMSKEGIYDFIARSNPPEVAQYAVDNLVADYNQNALSSARELLDDYKSKAGIQEDLEYWKFTPEEIQYAMDRLDDVDFNEVALKEASYYLVSLNKSKDEIYKKLVEEDLFTPEEAQYAIDHLENAVSSSPDDSVIDGINFSVSPFNSDPTGNWRVSVISTVLTPEEMAFPYYNKYMKDQQGDESTGVHWIVNLNDQTSTSLVRLGTTLEVNVYERIPQTEYDPRKIGNGELLRKYDINTTTGVIEQIQ